MIAIRPLRWPADRDAILALDTSFTTDRVYRLEQQEHSFALAVEPVTPPRRKHYDLGADSDTLPHCEHVLVAEIDASLIGLAALKIEAWNRRAVIWHFYVDASYRGQGIGRHLMERVQAAAQLHEVRCLWLETQTINYGAIQFYTRIGFQWCGLDTSLYDPAVTPPDEIALFFSRPLP